MSRVYLPVLFLCVAISCSVDVPNDIISRGKMERILYDYHRAQGMAETAEGDAEVNRYLFVQQVFKKYGVSEAEFDSSMVWYSGHSQYLVEMYKNIDDRLQRESSMLGMESSDDIYANLTAYGDTAIVWRATNVCMRNISDQNIATYNIIPDSTFLLGDTYELRFGNRFVVQDGQREGYVLLVARFENDSLASATTRVGGDFDANISIAQSLLTDTAHLSTLQIVFYYPYDEDKTEKFQLWMVNSPMLIRFHHATEEQPDEIVEEQDTIADALADTLDLSQEKTERLTPQQLRDSHEGERKIKVTKQKKVIMPSSNRNGNTRRK